MSSSAPGSEAEGRRPRQNKINCVYGVNNAAAVINERSSAPFEVPALLLVGVIRQSGGSDSSVNTRGSSCGELGRC